MHLRPFEIGLIGLFAVFAIGGLIFVSLIKGGDDAEVKTYGERVVIWGAFDPYPFVEVFTEISTVDDAFSVVSYRQIDERSFESELLNAIAEGTPPDLVLLPHTLLATYRTKLTPIPNESLDVRTLRDTYIDGAGIFTLRDGTYAVPFAVDPLVLYWNRDLFSNAGLARPPKTWENLTSESLPALTKVNERREVTQSAIAFGEYQNVNHAKEILSMLLFQVGTTIVEEGKDGRYSVTLSNSIQQGLPPAYAALNFYTKFVSPTSDSYTWGRTRPFDRSAFTGGTLAMYFGFGSEISAIENENPNLSFDIAPVPQSEGATALRSFGTFYGFAIPRASKNQAGAFRAALVLSEASRAGTLVPAVGLTPVHRSLYAGVSANPYADILEQSALISRGWIDPSPRDSDTLFKSMIENLIAGRGTVEQIINDAAYSLETLF